MTSTLTDLTLRSKETSISMLLNSTAGKLTNNILRWTAHHPLSFFFSYLLTLHSKIIGEYLKNRTYRGLEANVGQDEAAEVQEGLSGIARGYHNEKEDGDDEE